MIPLTARVQPLIQGHIGLHDALTWRQNSIRGWFVLSFMLPFYLNGVIRGMSGDTRKRKTGGTVNEDDASAPRNGPCGRLRRGGRSPGTTIVSGKRRF